LPRTFVMAGGGTGGHVLPALAVARELRARGHQVRFVGVERGMEAKLVPAANFPIEWIAIGGLNRVGFRQTLATHVFVSSAQSASMRHATQRLVAVLQTAFFGQSSEFVQVV